MVIMGPGLSPGLCEANQNALTGNTRYPDGGRAELSQ